MQLGIRLHDIKKAPLEERLAIAHEQGFACGHLALAKVISEYPVDDGALTPGYAMYLKKIFGSAWMLLESRQSESGKPCKEYAPLSGAYPVCIAARCGCGRHGNRSSE